MIWALAGAISVAATLAARPPEPIQPVAARRYPSAVDALEVALADGPKIVAFGELHQTRATAQIPSALHRFREQILPVFGVRFSHLVVETWVTSGRCGATERAVTEDIRETTERPAATENEIETLLRAAAADGIAPRILSITCADYASMRPQEGQSVDYDKTLRVTARALETAALAALHDTRRAGVGRVDGEGRTASALDAGRGRSTLAIYGGALHNDVDPEPDLRPYSMAPALMAASLGRYVEIDLVVPEYAAGSAPLRAQAWWKAYLRVRRPGATVMIRRNSRSFVIVFPADSKRHKQASSGNRR